MTFSNTDLLSRRLSDAGCRLAGAQLATHAEQLAKEGVSLVADVASHVEAVKQRTAVVNVLAATETSMRSIDRGADRCIAALNNGLTAIEQSLADADVLPLSPAEHARLEAVRVVRGTALPSGTTFLTLPYRQQYDRMVELSRKLSQAQVKAAITLLGLDLHVDRVGRWLDLYGRRLGITEARADQDESAAANQAWHEAWADLLVSVRSHYRDGNDPAHVRIRSSLLSPYERQAEAERLDDDRRRSSKRQPPPTDPEGGS